MPQKEMVPNWPGEIKIVDKNAESQSNKREIKLHQN
jgi:hypothetical protein